MKFKKYFFASGHPHWMKTNVPLSFLMALLITMILVNKVCAQTIASFSPSSGAIGTTVTITGSNFSATPTNNIVYFGATRATVTSAATTQLTVTVPAGATYQPISVLVNGLTAYSRVPFAVTFPGGGVIGANSFAPKVDLNTSAYPHNVAIGDLDDDGKPDLVVANYGASVLSIYKNGNTPGGITASSFAPGVDFSTGSSAYPYYVDIGDLDGDGKLDLAVVTEVSDKLSIFKNTSSPGVITTSSFASKVDFGTGYNPRSIAIGDLDGDGKPDLAIANAGSNTISVFKNASTPGVISGSSFNARVDFPTGAAPESVAMGDLDGDGKPELVVANFDHSTISILRNTSNLGAITASSFAPKVDFSTGSTPTSVVIGDLDLDGKSDLVVTNYNGKSISVFSNTSTAGVVSFATRVDFATSTFPRSTAIGDLNGDGRPDLAVAANQVSLFQNAGMTGAIAPNSFQARVDLNAFGHYVSIGDLDGDGKPDLAINTGENKFSVFQNLMPRLAITSFSPTYGTTGTAVTITGVKFDPTPANNTVAFNGTAAIVTASTSTSITTSVPPGAITGPLTVIVGGVTAIGSANFTVTNIASVSPVSGAIGTTVNITGFGFDPAPANNIVSFNGTVATVTSSTATTITTAVPAGATTGAITVTVNGLTSASPARFTITPSPITSFSPPSGPIGTAVTINGSNFDPTSAHNIVFFGATRATVTTAAPTQLTVTVPAGATYQPLSVMVNGLTAYSSSPFVVTFPGGGTIDANSFAAKVDFMPGTDPGHIAIGDLDGDGKTDLVVANIGSNTVSVFKNTSTTGVMDASSFAQKVDFPAGATPVYVVIGDLNGDGKPDLAVANYSSTVSVFKNTSITGTIDANSFAAKVDFAASPGPIDVAIFDLDGDGKPDLVVTNNIHNYSNTVSVFKNTGTTGAIDASSFAEKIDFAAGPSPQDVAIGDLDGDGKPDFAVTNYTNSGSSMVSLFQNTSATGAIDASSFAPKVDLPTGATPVYLAIGDLDGDGKSDLAVTNYSSRAVSIFKNTSITGTIDANSFAEKVDFATGDFPAKLAISDLDGDGKPDLAVTNYSSGTISVFKNTSILGAAILFDTPIDFPGSGAGNIAIGDLDGDGRPDLSVINSPSISILRNVITDLKITSFSPTFGTTGATVIIAGTNFDSTPANNTVAFNGTPATVTASTSHSITTSVPAGATTGAITVIVSGQTATSATNFAITNIGSFSPTSGPFGTTVTITGIDFDPTPANNLVAFNGTVATVTMSTATSITTTVPAGATTGPISVTVNGLTTASEENFMVPTPPPTIDSFTPTSGPIGTAVTISGTNFDPLPAKNIVYFGATKATVTSAKLTQLTVTAPTGATYQPISVMVNGLTAYSRAPFVVTFPGGRIDANSFVARVDFAAGSAPTDVAIGDIDGDGKSDLVVTNYSSTSVSVFKNTASPGAITASSFANKVDFITGLYSNGVAIGDLDGDGKPDLAVANGSSNSVSVFKNTATSGAITTSSFAARVDFAIGSFPTNVAIGDIDGDGKPDLVVSIPYSHAISVLKNTTPSGVISINSFALKVDFTTGDNYPWDVAIGDLDEDRKPDVVATSFGNVAVFKNTSTTGPITASSFTKFDFPAEMDRAIAIGDLDGDGKPDLAGPKSGGGVSVLKNTTTKGAVTLSFVPGVDFTTGSYPFSAAIGDLNGDGKPDLGVAIEAHDLLSLFENTATTGTISASSFAAKVDFTTGNFPFSVAIGDLDGDGKSDLASANSDGTASVFRNSIKANQTITFNGLSTKTIENPPFYLSATSTSGLAILFSTLSDKVTLLGNQVTLVKPGSVSITADQSGNDNFRPAASVTQTFCINPAKPIITVDASHPEAPVLTTNAGESYQWFRGETFVNSTPSITVTEAGIYTVRVGVNGCISDLSDPQAIIITGDLSKNTSEISVYPIPVHEQLIVKGASLHSGNWGVLNILGYESQPPVQFSEGDARIDVSKLTSGIYFLRANDGKKMVYIKFIKE